VSVTIAYSGRTNESEMGRPTQNECVCVCVCVCVCAMSVDNASTARPIASHRVPGMVSARNQSTNQRSSETAGVQWCCTLRRRQPNSVRTSTDRLDSTRTQPAYPTEQDISPAVHTCNRHADDSNHLDITSTAMTAKHNNEQTSSLRSVKMASGEDRS